MTPFPVVAPANEDALAKQREHLLRVAVEFTEELRDGQSCAPTALRSIALLEGLERAQARIITLQTENELLKQALIAYSKTVIPLPSYTRSSTV